MLVAKYKAEGAALKLLRDHVKGDFEATKRAYRIAWALSGLPLIAEDRKNGRYLCGVVLPAQPTAKARLPTGWKLLGNRNELLVPIEVSTKLELFSLRGPSLQRLTMDLFPRACTGEFCQYGQDIAGDWYIWGKPHWGLPVL